MNWKINKIISPRDLNSIKMNGMNDIRDYKYMFTTAEWVTSYLDIFFKDSILYNLTDGKNSIILEENKNNICFCGDPFNDYNGIFNNTECAYEIDEFLGFVYNKKFKFENLFEESVIDKLRLGLNYNRKEIVTNGYIDNIKVPFSRRIIKLFEKTNDNIKYDYLNKEHCDFQNCLNWLLKTRNTKLAEYKINEYNPSFDESFSIFIKKFVSKLDKRFCFLTASRNRNNDFLAANLYFTKGNDAICYLRAHKIDNDGVLSYGLMLDYWIKTISSLKVDYSRGTEDYKKRLGTVIYDLINVYNS